MSESFAPLASLVGGMLIGGAASLLWLVRGRVAGISGITGGAVLGTSGPRAWRWAFLAGLLAVGLVSALVMPEAFNSTVPREAPVLIGAGLLVGFGTPRQRVHERPRHLRAGAGSDPLAGRHAHVHRRGRDHRVAVGCGVRWLVDALIGALFGVGLVVSGMTQPGKVIGFLDFTGAWDPSLVLVMVGALLVHGLTSWAFREQAAPLLGEGFDGPTHQAVDAPLVAGSALFGVGWGLAGYCPGPAIVGATSGSSAALFLAAMVAGMALHALLERAVNALPAQAPDGLPREPV